MTTATPISRVLVGVDFDDASAAALRMAGVLAAAWNASLTVFHSSQDEAPAYFTAAQFEQLEAERAQSRAASADRLHRFAAPHLPAAFRVEVGEGPPQDALLRMASAFDLVVVGTHRRHGPRRWWLGSIAEAVVRGSTRPVLVVPDGAVLPERNQDAAVLAVRHEDADGLDAWVEAMRSGFSGTVVGSVHARQCAPDVVRSADVLVVSMPSASDARVQPGAIVEMLKECVHPVLFVPIGNGILERSSL